MTLQSQIFNSRIAYFFHYVCSKIFLIRVWSHSASASQPSDVSSNDLDVLYYICGFLLKVLKSYGTDINHLVSSDVESGHCQLTKIYDHGGLLYPTIHFFQLVQSLENKFREFVWTNKVNVDWDCFINTCVTSEQTSLFSVPTFKKCIKLFFNVRMFHKCKMATQLCNTSKSKGLRKTLKK